MKKNWLVYLFLGISFLANIFFLRNNLEQNRVVEVVDGDTFQLKSGKRVRLMGVDAPEFELCGGKQAKERLTGLLYNKIVILQEEVTESFGRSLALVFVNGKFINKIIMEEGWGRADYRKNSRRDELTQAFHLAENEKRGIFGLCRETVVPDDEKCKIKGNIDPATYEKFYHLPNCSHYSQIVIQKDRGERYFCTKKEAISSGFKKAAGCP